MSEKDIRDLIVKDVFEILSGKPAIVKEGSVLKDAVEAIIQRSTSRKVYVVDDAGKLEGMITIETLLRHVGYRVGVRETGMISFFKFLSGILKEDVADIMEKPVTITKKHKILDALQMMVEHHLNDLPIVDEEERIIGELHSFQILANAKDLFEE
ncbi:CBS domain-containing protein [[Eubacterium] cellulosolvens]